TGKRRRYIGAHRNGDVPSVDSPRFELITLGMANGGKGPGPLKSDRKGQRGWLLLSAAFILMAGMHLYFNNVVIPAQESDALAHDKPRGNNSDLYPRWLGARELLLHNRDPY